MPGFASLSVASAAAVQAASLNLCTDELLLMLAEPQQIVSVTHLAQREAETPLWRQARRYPRNDGTLLGVIAHRPNLILTMGGQGQDRQNIARRLGIRTIVLPYPQSLDDVIASVRTVSRALGRISSGEAVVRQIDALRAGARPARMDALYLTGGGQSVAASGLAADWMALAGLKQRALRGDRVSLEQLLVSPPTVLLKSSYRAGEYSTEQRWLGHPLAARARAKRTLVTDGRRWTCMGPLLIPEIQRLRRDLAK